MKLLIALVLLGAIAICTLLPSQIHSTKKKVISQRDLGREERVRDEPGAPEPKRRKGQLGRWNLPGRNSPGAEAQRLRLITIER